MGKNYYCDYCSKSFKDILAMRKNHLKGLQHQRAKSEHYAKYKTVKEIYKEESRKKTCKRIFEGQPCNFGSQCRFSHFTAEQLDQMRRQIAETEAAENRTNEFNPEAISKILKKASEKILWDKCSVKPFWSYPYDMVEGLELPPSLQPIDPKLLPEKPEDCESLGESENYPSVR
ncbi:zinc finger matrin-type protein 5 [Phlebotomus argentipes]|uniref:zinc finger matrin-type protein 5 n=1 Tax=Phlebotomus argentipes TaxID=94469 RepID=UPI002893641D|nr:zinc finger matrin-type protein 5 [Phlebotomus argentipes]